MVEVPLTKDKVALIDDEDAARVLALQWYYHVTLNRRGDVKKTYAASRSLEGGRRFVYLHRFVMNAPLGMQVDHKDSNGLNCQKSNLRLATKHQNAQNVGVTRQSTTGFKGVHTYRFNTRTPYRVRLKHKGVEYCLGFYATAEDGARAYDKKARELFGEFACVNFPLPHERGTRKESK